MKKGEAERILRVQRCCGGIVDLCPSNPSDLERKEIVVSCVRNACSLLYRAISSVGHGDMAEADDYLDSAEEIISESRRKISKRAEAFYHPADTK